MLQSYRVSELTKLQGFRVENVTGLCYLSVKVFQRYSVLKGTEWKVINTGTLKL